MDMDFTGAKGSFQFTPKGKPGPDGEHGNLKITLKLELNVPIDFLDKYLDGHLSGAQPSSVFWREVDPGEKDTDAYPRYMGIKNMQLEVSEDRKYAFKIKAPRPEAWEGDWNGEVVTLLGGLLKAVSVSPGANGASAKITYVVENQRHELASALAGLVVLEEVAVDGWLMDRDLPLGKPGEDNDDPDASNREETQGEALGRAFGVDQDNTDVPE